MANALYTSFKQNLLAGTVGGSLAGATVFATLVAISGANPYTAAVTTDATLSAVPAASRIAGPTALASGTVTNGIFNAANITFSAVAASSTAAGAVVLSYGSAGTAPLIAYIDTATGLPVTPNGGDITIAWDTGANKIFAL